ncbi:transcriptional regulator [Plantactinospora sp. KBS50]|uniref:ArsR/SmtB family transcription factor n=1 Tax=Plantactinospora sp. KBS50 TaxID=2024580 RepID=UPI000BAB06D3|nr:helix-turn-helix domain-containing protein [Plantactinospora sp. KBS50]ASW53063.1 transcriptional regulator [Plantactinospora sp. KBS50]
MSLGDGSDGNHPAGTPQESTIRLRALAHPVRLRILSLLTGAPLTAAEVARELDLTHANASYHLRQLLAAGAIVVTAQERIRGGAAKRYRYDPDRDRDRERDERAKHDHQGQRVVYEAVSTELRRRAEHRRAGGTGHLADAELWVDPEVWAEVREQVADAMVRLHRAARAPRSPGTTHVNATVALFEMED